MENTLKSVVHVADSLQIESDAHRNHSGSITTTYCATAFVGEEQYRAGAFSLEQAVELLAKKLYAAKEVD